MGCVYIKPQKPFKEEKSIGAKYSWDNKPKVNPEDYIVQNLKNETAGRLPGTVNGQQFIIQNCQNCNIYIFDHINTINVDNCLGCNVFLGPVKGSIFLRDCQDCRFVLTCQQFRARDCKHLDIFLFCATQPCIETCFDMKFGCLCYHYTELDSQFRCAGLSVFNNRWNEIHDFTPVEGECTWELLPKDAKVHDFLPAPDTEPFAQVQISTDPITSFVPQTKKQNIAREGCLVVFFVDVLAQEFALEFIQQMEQKDVTLVQTIEITIDEMEAQKLFGTNAYNQAVKSGPMIALEYNGKDCKTICENTIESVVNKRESPPLVYVSSTSEIPPDQMFKLFDFR